MPSAFTMKLAKIAEEQFQTYHLHSEGTTPSHLKSGVIGQIWDTISQVSRSSGPQCSFRGTS